jgi:chromate transporter
MILLLDIAFHALLWTALAVGGANVTIPDMQRYAVLEKGWLSSNELVSYISLAQAAPGPNGMTIVLIGLHTAGFFGAAVSILASVGPTSIFAYYAGGWMEDRKSSIWIKALRKGLAPITVGLFAAACIILVREVDTSFSRGIFTLVGFSTAYLTKVNPIWIVIGGSLGGVVGLPG